MSFLKEFLDSKTIEEIENIYDKSMIANIYYKKDEVLKIIKYLDSLGFDIKTIVINRLDIFLLDFDYVKKKIESNKDEIENLKEDFSLFDELN